MSETKASPILGYQCIIQGCPKFGKSLKRIDKHYLHTHQIQSGSQEYKFLRSHSVITVPNTIDATLGDTVSVPASSTSKISEHVSVTMEQSENSLENVSLQNVSNEDNENHEAQVHQSITRSDEEQPLSDHTRIKNESEDRATCSKKDVEVCENIDLTNQLEQFKNFLSSIDGGKKAPNVTTLHTRHVKSILKTLRLPSEHEVPTLCKHFFAKRHLAQWFTTAAETKPPGTVRAYLASLRCYLTFLRGESGGQEFHRSIDEIQSALPAWSAALKRDNVKRKVTRQLEESKLLINAEHIAKYRSSEYCKHTLKALRSVRTKRTIKTAIRIRNILMTEILLQNGLRSGAMAALTIQHLQEAKFIVSTDCYCMSVVEHKTLATFGACNVSVTSKLYEDLKLYCQRYRSVLIKNSKCPNETLPQSLFVLANGKPMTTNHMSLAVRAAWVGSGLNSNLTVSLFRKSIVTRVHEKNPSLAGRLAKLLAHRLTTATSYYSLYQNQQDTTETSIQMRAIMENGNCSDASEIKTYAEKETQTDMDEERSLCSNCKCTIATEPIQDVQPDNTLTQSKQPVKPHGRRSFEPQDVHMMKDLFFDFIRSKKISTQELRNTLARSKNGKYLASKYTINQLRDRIRTFYR